MFRLITANSLALASFVCALGASAQPAPAPNPAPAPAAPPANAPAVNPSPAPAPEAPPSAPAPTDAAPPAATLPTPSATPAEPPPAESSGGLFEQSQAGAEGASTTGTEPAPGRALPVDLNGYVRGDVFVGKAPGAKDGLMQAAYGEFALKVTSQKQTYGDAFAELRFRYGQEGDRRDLFVNVREAYVNLYLGPLDLRLGQQVIVWGRADAFNPTNNLTPIDLRVRSPIEDDRRMGNVGARAFLNFAPIRVEGVWMPLYAPSELPAIALPEFVAFGKPYYPPPKLDKGLYAGRLHLELPSFEASVSALYGHAPLPGLQIRDYSAGVNPPEIRIARTAYDQQVYGADFSTALGDIVGLRGEIAYRHPMHHKSRVYAARPDLQYVLGVDRTFGPVSVILQYVGRKVFDWRLEPGPEMPLDPFTLSTFDNVTPSLDAEIRTAVNDELRVRNQILFGQTKELQHLVSARVEWVTMQDTLSLSALGLVNFSTKEWLLFPKLAYKISDTMSTSIGGEIYAGPDGTLFGLVDELLSAGYAELRMSF